MLNKIKLESDIKDFFDNGHSEDIDKNAEIMFNIYFEYIKNAENSFSKGLNVPVPSYPSFDLTRDSALGLYKTAYHTQKSASIATGIANAFTVLWTGVTFPKDLQVNASTPPNGISPNIWVSST